MEDSRRPVNAPWIPATPLNGDQLRRLAAVGSEHVAVAGEVLFAAGDASYDLFVVLEGAADVVERSGQADGRLVASYGPAEFLGEVGMLTGQRARFDGVMRQAGRLLRVPVRRVLEVSGGRPERGLLREGSRRGLRRRV